MKDNRARSEKKSAGKKNDDDKSEGKKADRKPAGRFHCNTEDPTGQQIDQQEAVPSQSGDTSKMILSN